MNPWSEKSDTRTILMDLAKHAIARSIGKYHELQSAYVTSFEHFSSLIEVTLITVKLMLDSMLYFSINSCNPCTFIDTTEQIIKSSWTETINVMLCEWSTWQLLQTTHQRCQASGVCSVSSNSGGNPLKGKQTWNCYCFLKLISILIFTVFLISNKKYIKLLTLQQINNITKKQINFLILFRILYLRISIHKN